MNAKIFLPVKLHKTGPKRNQIFFFKVSWINVNICQIGIKEEKKSAFDDSVFLKKNEVNFFTKLTKVP